MAWTEEQLEAINKKGKNIIVSAGAGSGKTAVLTARTLRILKEGTHINELLILTFTKAAAAEMKERIRSSISEDPSLKGELDLIDQSYVTTFDSFALSIVKKYHYLLNISNNISISEETIIEMKKEQILDEVFEDYYVNRKENFTKLIKDFCVKDDNTIKKSILTIASKIDGMPSRDEYLNNYLSNIDNEKIYNEYLNILNEIKTKCNNAYENFIYSFDEKKSEKIQAYGSSLFNAKNINEISSSIDSLGKFPVLKLDEEESNLREEYKNTIEDLKGILKYGTEEEIKEGLNNTTIYITAVLDIIKEFLNRLHTYKEQNEIYDFQDIALLSIKILKEFEEVREELKNTFKEIMIDEYQDTNDIQETFISMIENNNVYMVGDIKQSIYRFRNANPYIFKNKYDNYKNDNGGIKIDLVKNFRSREEVKTGINDIFNLIMDDAVGGAEYQESHQMIFGNKTYSEEGKTNQDYNLEILEYPYDKETPYTKEEIEIFAIAKDIKNKIDTKYQVFDKSKKVLKNIEYKDFVILMDRSYDFDLYKKIFEYLGIPLALYKDDKINNSDDIYIIKNIIDFIVRIKEGEIDTTGLKYDFISIARSYLYDYDDETIFKYFLNNNIVESPIYNDFKEISNNITHLSVTNILEQIITKTNMYEKLIEVGNIDSAILRISKLIDVADNLSTLGYNIITFRDYLNTLIDEEYDMKYSNALDSSNAVKIMTIHKSKGLEYHICYYSGLYKGFNIQDLNNRFMFDNRYGILTPYFKEGIHETITKYLIKYHYLEEEVGEKIRLFYVALTRAKEKMIMLTPECDSIDYSLDSNNTIDEYTRRNYRSFKDIIESIKTKIPNYFKQIDINELGITDEYLFNKVKENKLPKSKEILEVKEINIPLSEELDNKHFSKETHNLIDKKTYDNMKYGLKIHETLELIDFKKPKLDLIKDEFIKEKVQKFLQSDIIKNSSDANYYKEHEFIYTKDFIEYHGIIDLMIEHPDYIDIIDYKLSNTKDENYLKQLNGYKEYIEELTHKKTNIYLYSIIGEKIEKL